MASYLASYIVCMLIQRPFTYHSCDTQHPCTVVCDILFTVTHEAVLLAECFYQRGLSLEKRSLYTCQDGTRIYTVFTRLDYIHLKLELF